MKRRSVARIAASATIAAITVRSSAMEALADLWPAFIAELFDKAPPRRQMHSLSPEKQASHAGEIPFTIYVAVGHEAANLLDGNGLLRNGLPAREGPYPFR